MPLVTSREGGVAAQGHLTCRPPVGYPAQLAATCDPEVERGADSLGCERQAVPRRVTGEEDLAVCRLAQLVRDPVALVANRIAVQVARQPNGGVLDPNAGVEGANAHPDLVVGGEAPAVAGGHVVAVDPDLQLPRGSARVHLQPARERRVHGLVAVGAEHASPTKAVDDQRGVQVATVGMHGRASPPVDLCRLELGVTALEQQLAQGRIVEGRERPRKVHAGGDMRGVNRQVAEGLLDRCAGSHRIEPLGGSRAGRGLALPDLVTVDDQDPRPRTRQLSRHREAGEARPADQHVAVVPQGCSFRAALRAPSWHLGRGYFKWRWASGARTPRMRRGAVRCREGRAAHVVCHS